MISIGPSSAMAAAFRASASMLSTWALISMFRAIGSLTTELTNGRDVAERRTRNFVRSNVLLGIRCPRTWTLHCDFRFGEAKLLIERSNTRRDRPQNPSDSPVVTHRCLDQGA